ncbi:aminopeptidase N [Stomoxys calcitrans]|uniref:Aminopeptidase n=1 Tax=Stomoxys calcitrans TaxID=35570 RepID=A0A1I8NZK0_STOCA|nr:aminopeptidase N [Stomoxys calcitrans]
MGTKAISLKVLLSLVLCTYAAKIKRSIDLSASHALIQDVRLPMDILPTGYEIDIRPNLEDSSFSGSIKINMSWTKPTRTISLHAHYDLQINDRSIKLTKKTWESGNETASEEYIKILRGDRLPKKTVYIVYLKDTIKECSQCELAMEFEGGIWKTNEGIFKGTYISDDGEENTYLATYMRPNNARRLFPCFDEPGFKVPFKVSIARPRNFVTLFNTQLLKTEELDATKPNLDYVVDHFEVTPPMSTFTFGFVISQLKKIDFPMEYASGENKLQINIWASKKNASKFEDTFSKLTRLYNYMEEYFNSSLPLSKIDVIAIPELPLMHPSDNWGLILFKETELLNLGYYHLAQELIYQWLGSWITLEWWSDIHVNKALTSFLAANFVFQIDSGKEFNGKYPMTILYSLYYEFSKRYPHSRITGMKQESTSYKIELFIRMLNYTLGHDSLRAGIENFMASRHFKTFSSNDLWNALTVQSLLDKTLPSHNNVTDIANSWISKNRLPSISVQRDYAGKRATVTQKVYLRERPHDVPEQDKMLWWIPLVFIEENNLNFSYTRPIEWMPYKRDLILNNMPADDKFVIVNPEEIGPFPVNYDIKNWNMLSSFLQTNLGLSSIPALTRAKLLHDAWNLAYAGDLSFATAFNMTLFMQLERDPIVWNPVFTFIDHIGRHIDGSDVHEQFQAYIRHILTPLYLELSEQKNNLEIWHTELLSMAETFLCRAGYTICVEEAQQAFKQWMESDMADEKFMISNKYICPALKWGTMEEWQFGLMRVINFPKSRIQSERTYLLKNLAGCPVQSEKIVYLLNIAIIERNANFTENDIILIFNMLNRGSGGNKILLNFLSNNWSTIRNRFENKTNLWDSLISSATGSFTTDEGYKMVKTLFDEHRNEFGSALHIIEKSLKNIQEEAKWSEENLPVIENWLTEFFHKNHPKDE